MRGPGAASRSLDLHGVRHGDVEGAVEEFVLRHQDEMPLEVVCGGSAAMLVLVRKVLDRLGLEHGPGWQGQFGRLLVTGWRESAPDSK